MRRYFEAATAREAAAQGRAAAVGHAEDCGGTAQVRAHTRQGPSGPVQVQAHTRAIPCH